MQGRAAWQRWSLDGGAISGALGTATVPDEVYLIFRVSSLENFFLLDFGTLPSDCPLPDRFDAWHAVILPWIALLVPLWQILVSSGLVTNCAVLEGPQCLRYVNGVALHCRTS